MEAILRSLRRTRKNRVVGGARIMVGLVIVMTGVMKFSVPMLREAWSGQLIQADIPFPTFNFWVVPAIEIGVGSAWAFGLFSRVGALVVFGVMVVAAYVHLTVGDPGLFPLQPHEPIIPLVIMALTLLVKWRGGAWSADLRAGAKIEV